MAHYAFVDDLNVVQEVIAGNDETTGDWEAYYADVRGQRCLRTSYHACRGVHSVTGEAAFRGNYAAQGMIYNAEIDAFVDPCPGEGWTLDPATASWVESA